MQSTLKRELKALEIVKREAIVDVIAWEGFGPPRVIVIFFLCFRVQAKGEIILSILSCQHQLYCLDINRVSMSLAVASGDLWKCALDCVSGGLYRTFGIHRLFVN